MTKDLISEHYRNLNAEVWAKRGKGNFRPRHQAMVELVKRLVDKDGLKSILDYGCGNPPHLMVLGDIVRNYDPAIPKFSALPEPADLVVCSHVLEHIEPLLLDNVLDHIKALAMKKVLLIIPHYRAKQMLSDGRNAHLTVEPAEWWLPRLEKRWEREERKLPSHAHTDRALWFIGKVT